MKAWRRSRVVALLAVVVTALLAVSPAFAADDNKIIFPSGGAGAAAPVPASGGSANAVTLGVALLLAGGGGWVMWRKRQAAGPLRESKALAIDETRSLGNRQYLVVASYEGKKFLLGVCPGRIDMLAPLDERRSDGGPS